MGSGSVDPPQGLPPSLGPTIGAAPSWPERLTHPLGSPVAPQPAMDHMGGAGPPLLVLGWSPGLWGGSEGKARQTPSPVVALGLGRAGVELWWRQEAALPSTGDTNPGSGWSSAPSPWQQRPAVLLGDRRPQVLVAGRAGPADRPFPEGLRPPLRGLPPSRHAGFLKVGRLGA